MKRSIIAALFALLPLQAQAMGERPVIDPACFASETLRVEIGGEKFAFPRKMVRVIQGEDVINSEDPTDHSASASQACQKITDKMWRLDNISLNIYPKPCPADDPECNEMFVRVDVSDMAYRKSLGLTDDVYPNTKNELLDKCIPPSEPFSPWHAKVWSTCNYIFQDSGLGFSISFRGGIYPPEQIEDTQALVLKTIRQHLIK